VKHETSNGVLYLDEETVNDRFIAEVNFSGDVAWWSVAAIGPDQAPGPAASATFTTVRAPATLLWPPDGATIHFPDADAIPTWRGPVNQESALRADHAIGSLEPPADAPPSQFGLGDWRWAVGPGDNPPAYGSTPWSEIRTFSYVWNDSAPTLTAPADQAAVDQGATVRLAWQPVPGAAKYAWEVRDSSNAVVAGNVSGIRATWVDVSGNLNGTEVFTWRVRGVMAGTEMPNTPVFGAWSTPRHFTVWQPDAPVITAPDHGANLDAWPVLRWTDVPGARSYQIEIATSPDDPAQLINPTVPVAAFSFNSPGAATDLSVGDPAGGDRIWRVRAWGSASFDDLGGWSEWKGFRVKPTGGDLPAETAATPLGPADCASDACPDIDGVPLLRWSPVAKAASYRVFFRWDGGAGPADSWVDTASTGLSLRQYNQTSPGDRTAWSVLACPLAGCSEAMPAARRHFRIGLPAPEPLEADGIVQAGPSVSMRWAPIGPPEQPDALLPVVQYEVRFTATGTSDVSDVRYDGYQVGDTIDAIRDGTTVAWKVRATSYIGSVVATPGAFSEVRTVTRIEPAIQLTSPGGDAVVGSAPTLDWDPLPYGAGGYVVQVARVAAIEAYWPDWYDWMSTTGATSIRPGTLTPGAYRWRVARTATMYDQAEGSGPWSTGYFTVEGDSEIHPLTPAPGETIRGDDVTLTWAPIANADHSGVMIGTSADVTWDTAIYKGSTAGTTHPVRNTLPDGDLYWRVCTGLECSAVAGFSGGTPSEGSSAPLLLRVTAPPNADGTPPVSALGAVTPRLGTALGSTGGTAVTVTWTASDVGGGIASQELQVRKGTGAWLPIPVSAAARSAATILAPGATYAFRVRATDHDGNVGAWSTGTRTAALVQESSTAWTWSSGWTRSGSSSASGGAVRWTTKAGATGSLLAWTRAIALVAPKSTTRGSAWVYVDGVKVATIRLDTSPTGSRRIAWVGTWAKAGTHRISIRAAGTAGHPRIDVDAAFSLR
jgi:hypothetical protein